MSRTTRLVKGDKVSREFMTFTEGSTKLDVWQYSDCAFLEIQNGRADWQLIKLSKGQAKKLVQFLKKAGSEMIFPWPFNWEVM